MKISNTKLDLYEACGRKYKFRYVDNLKGDYTSSALLFGTALDSSLNYILESIRDKKEWSIDAAREEFARVLETWNGQNRLDFFKGDVPKELVDQIDEGCQDFQEQVWETLYKRGMACVDVYVKDILPLFKEIISVQDKVEILNSDGDIFNGVVDFIARLQDDRVVLFDNKSSSAKYPKNKVVKSQQLSLYLEKYPEIKLAGYIVLIKNPEKEKGMTHQILIDEIPEETSKDSFERLEAALQGIKSEEFKPNFRSCKLYGKPCEYAGLCQYGTREGLVEAYDKSKSK